MKRDAANAPGRGESIRARPPVPAGADAPHVALIVDTALASGRGILGGITAFTRRYGAWITFHEPRDLEHTIPAWLSSWRGHGIIARVRNRDMYRRLEATGLPVVDVLGGYPPGGFPLVHVDDAAIAGQAAKHLVDLGAVSFGFCHMEGQPWSLLRRRAFEAALRREGHACTGFALSGESLRRYGWESEQSELAAWLRTLPKPAGVMICSDWHGQTVLAACRRAGLRIPDDVALIGVDNDTTLCEACEPPLSSVQCDYERVGFEAAGLLARWMAGTLPPGPPVLVPPRGVVVRRSTDTLAIPEGHVAQALRLIRQQACAGLTVEAVVARVPCSRTALKRQFKAALGRSMHEEILNVRLDKALFLLRESALPIPEVAERSGFTSQAYLGAMLRQHHDTTPRQYRQQWQQRPTPQ